MGRNVGRNENWGGGGQGEVRRVGRNSKPSVCLPPART